VAPPSRETVRSALVVVEVARPMIFSLEPVRLHAVEAIETAKKAMPTKRSKLLVSRSAKGLQWGPDSPSSGLGWLARAE